MTPVRDSSGPGPLLAGREDEFVDEKAQALHVRGGNATGPGGTAAVVARTFRTFRRSCWPRAPRLAVLSAAFDLSPNAILTADPAGAIRSWSPGAQHTFGWRAEEVMARQVEMLVPPEERQRVAGALQRLRLSREPWRSEMAGLHRDGHLIRCAVTISPIVKRGRLVGTAMVATDVTEHRRPEAHQRQREHQLAEAQRLAHVGSWSWEVAADSVEWSDELFRMFGVDPERFDGTYQAYLDLVHPDDRPMVERTIREAVADSDSYELEHRVVRGEGTEVWVACRGAIERDETHTPVRLTGTAQDITERRRADQARSHLAAIVDSSDDAIISSTLDGVISTWNRGAEKLTGYRAEDVLGQHASFLVPDDRGHEVEAVLEKIRAGESINEFEALWVRKDGSLIPLSLTVSPMRDSHCSVVGASAVARDTTVRKRLEAKLAAARDEAVAASGAKSQFLAAMSHEIRTPMNGVIGMAGLLLDTELDPDQREYAETVRSSAEALLVVINDILDFSKVEAGRVDLEIIDFELRRIVEEVADLLADQAHRKGVELATVVARDVPTTLSGDPFRIRQILTNLVSNAVKFTTAGEVVLRVGLDQVTDEGCVVRVEVADTGIGIPPEVKARLFQPFSQADSSTTRTYGGTGLGLAISKQLLELMGGEIDVDSESGRGSTFRIALPLCRAAGAEAEPAPVDLSGRRVLVVDDNATNSAILVHHLAAWGMVPAVADGGPAALSALGAAARRGELPDVVLVDMAMPGMDGLSLGRAIGQDHVLAHVPLLLLTSASAPGSAAAARDAGFSACLTKPVRESQLLEAIARTICGKPPIRHSIARRTVPEPARVPGSRVLVAEDNPVNQRVIALQLAKLGYRADVVANGAEAVEALARIRYRAVLMDCQMPEMDGYAATAEVRRREDGARPVPIIALTAEAVAGARDRCLAAGMDDYVAKPFTQDDLAAVLKRWIPCTEDGQQLVLAR